MVTDERGSHRARPEAADKADDTFDPLDPAVRRAMQFSPHPHVAPLTTEAPGTSGLHSPPKDDIVPRARVSMEELLPQLVRRIAWAGDRHRGSVQLELGAGPHAGTVVTVHADSGRVRVELQGPGDLESLRRRIDARLERSGIALDSVTRS